MRKRFLLAVFPLLILSIVLTAYFAGLFDPWLASSLSKNHTTEDSGWTLVVDGFVQHSLNLSLNELKTMPKTRVNAAIYCVNQPDVAVASGNWTGIALRYILLEAGVTSEAIKIAFYAKIVSNYTFTTDLALEVAMRDDVIVAYERDNAPLNETLRLVVPGKWGYKWISELVRIEVTNYNFLGTFESHGYPDEADITD